MVLCGLTKVEVAVNDDDTITNITRSPMLYRRFLRGCMVPALLFSGLSVRLGLLTYAYMLEAKGSSRALVLAFVSPSTAPKP